MTSPVPGYPISTPYGRRGPYWSCSEDEYGNGIHTGADYAAPAGTPVVAARAGKVAHCHHGSAFGSHQLEILPGDGTRDFYAHMSSRAHAGAWVEVGDQVGKVGSEGNATGPHLHFERHLTASGGWSCSIITDPAPSIGAEPKPEGDPMPKCVNGSSNGIKFTGAWQNIYWDDTSGADDGVIAPGNPGFAFVGPYVATLSVAVLTSAAGILYTRTIEGYVTDSGGWDLQQQHPAKTLVLDIKGTNGHVDTRAQSLPKDARLRWQLLGPKGEVADVRTSVLYWP